MLKLTITSLLILLTFNLAIAQDKTFTKYIENGIALHDEGQYRQAIKQYEKALKIDKKSALANYEIALSHHALGDRKAALKYANKAAKGKGSQDMPMLYVMRGSLLDDSGKTKQAIKVYEQGIRRFPNDHMLYFNMGITYARMGMNIKAKNAFITTIAKNYSHASSHYYLGKMMEEEGEKVPAMLAYYFFLLLEPETIRSDEIYNRLSELSLGGTDVEKTGENEISINLSPDALDAPFSSVELFLSLQQAGNLTDETFQKKTHTEKLIVNTESFFGIMSEMKADNQGIWWDFYTPYYTHLVECESITTFCYHIGQSKGGDIVLWLEAHEEENIDFVNCVNEYGN